MKKILALLIGLLVISIFSFGQEKNITGKITNEQGEPVSYATIKIKGKGGGVSADVNGNYTISASPGDVLIISSTNSITREITVGVAGSINIQVAERDAILSEVVITALGISRESRSLGYSVQTIENGEITKARETNIINSLAGKIAGVQVTSQSGTLGGTSRIVIRGVSSLTGSSQPLFVIDGMPIENSIPAGGVPSGSAPSGFSSVDFGSRAGDINPDDVASISVLKGSTATALYGSRAKNGAIIITTKRGRGEKSSVSFNSSLRFDNVLKLPDLQNEYAQGNNGVYSLGSNNGWGPAISEVQDQQFPDFMGGMETLKAYPDNIKDFYETGHTYINSVAFESGGEQQDFRLGYTNTVQDGVISNQSLTRNSLSANMGRSFSDKLSVRTNINYVSTQSKGRPVQSLNDPNIITSIINRIPRTIDINKLRENYIDPATGKQRTLGPGAGNNPFWIINNNGVQNNVDHVYGNVTLSYALFSWLTLSNNAGIDFYNEFRRGVTRVGTFGDLSGSFLEDNLYNRNINNDLLLTSGQTLAPGLSAKFMVGGNINDHSFRRMQGAAKDLIVDGQYTYSNAESVITANYREKKRILGLFGGIDLNYKDYLFLSVTGRNDWSSTLPIANRSYFYPSVSSAFIFTEVVNAPSWLNYGKLRASWANVGSDGAPYQTGFYYTPAGSAFAEYGMGVTFPFNGALAYSIPNRVPGYDLKPENQSSFEIGTELHLLSSRINLDFTYYRSVTRDQIVALALANSTGFRQEIVNAGTIRNSGIEIGLNLVPVRTRDFNWEVDFNFSRNRQVLVDLPASLETYTLTSGWNALQIRAEKGKEFGIYGAGWRRDPSGNIIINANTGLRRFVNDTRLGDLYPDYLLGINNSFKYKHFNLGFLIDIRQGGVIYSGTVSGIRSSGLARETLADRGKEFIDEGVTINDAGEYVKNMVPVQSMEDYWSGNFNGDKTEANIFDASYVKLRELRLSYTIPDKYLTSGLKFIKSVEVGIEGRNLWIIHDNVPHIDPEVNFFTNDPVGEGVEFNSMPSTRSWGFNLRLKI